MNIPNLITIIRIVSVPVIVWLIQTEAYMAAFWLFMAAGTTDAIDGYLARRWNQRTELGAYLDALADKALLVSIYVALAVVGGIPVWLTIAVVSRDVMIIGAVILSWLLQRPVAIAPLRISKANTAGQIVFAGLVLCAAAYRVPIGHALLFTAWIVAALTLASAAAYLAQWMRHMAGAEMPR